MGDRLSPDRGYLKTPRRRVVRVTTYLGAAALEKALGGTPAAWWEILPEHGATLECGHELMHKTAAARPHCYLCGPAGGPPGERAKAMGDTGDRGVAGDTSPETVMYAGEPCRLHWDRYADGGRPALMLATLEGEPMATVTINVPEEPLAPGEVFINHDCVAMGHWPALEASGVFADTGRRVGAGFVSLVVARVLKGPAWARGEGGDAPG